MPEYCLYIHVFNGVCAEDHCLWCAGMCLPHLLSAVPSLLKTLVFHDLKASKQPKKLSCKEMITPVSPYPLVFSFDRTISEMPGMSLIL